MYDTLIIVILCIMLVAAYLVIPHLILAKTMPVVIKLFRDAGAVGADNARAPAALGLAQKPLIERALHRRDQKLRALQALITLEVVKTDEEGRIYLCEQGLARTRWSDL